MTTWLQLAAVVLVAAVIASLLWRRSGRAPPRDRRERKPSPRRREDATRSKKPPAATPAPALLDLTDPDGDYEEVTVLTLHADKRGGTTSIEVEEEEDGARDPTTPGRPAPMAKAISIVADPGAEENQPTRDTPFVLLSATGQTDRGKTRRKNEDRYLALNEYDLFMVADGMGGYAGGDVAAELSASVIEKAFREATFTGELIGELPRRAAELALAIQMANLAIFERAEREEPLKGMGTTIVAARFATTKDRLYIGHVGDSRCYRLRDDELRLLTTDHTLRNLGFDGPGGDHLHRAVGIGKKLEIDLIMAKPRVGDVYLLCSDGLTKMVRDDREIRDMLLDAADLEQAVARLIEEANARGGRDNVTIVAVAVRDVASVPPLPLRSR